MSGDVLIGASAALFGAVIGSAVGILGGKLRHDREVRAERENERWEREKAAAFECDRLFRELAQDIPAKHKYAGDVPEVRERADRVLASLDRVEALAIDLPLTVSERVLLARNLLSFADELAAVGPEGGFHYDSIFVIADEVNQCIHKQLVAFMRREALPPLSKRVQEYEFSYGKLMARREEEFAAEIADSHDEREAWLKRFPDAPRD